MPIFPISNVKVTRTATGVRVCGTVSPPAVNVAGEIIQLPAFPVCMDVSKDQAMKVLGDVRDESRRATKRLRRWFARIAGKG